MRPESANPSAESPGQVVSVALADILPEDPPEPRESVALFLQILRSVDRLHASGQPGAELSPRHIRIRQTGDAEIVPASSGARTAEDLKYAAPEAQAGETAGSPGISGDIYSLGFLFYEILVGSKRFSAQFTGTQWPEWHRDSELRARPLKRVRANFPPRLSDLIERMTEKRVDRRAASFADVIRAFEEVHRRLEAGQTLDGIPLPAPPGPWKAAAGPKAAPLKNWKLWVAAGAAPLLVVILLGRAKDRPATPSARTSLPIVSQADASSSPQSIETPTGPMELIPEQPAFYLDKFEVANSAYLRFCELTGRTQPAPPAWDRRYFDKANYPVVGLSWEDARAFAGWAGKRLPSRTEWEKAAMGADNRPYPWGNWYEPGTANLRDAKRRGPAAVGWFAFDFSPYGVMDMGGNVAEWVGNETPAVRGGSFRTRTEEAKITTNGSSDPSSVGFRCAADAKTGLSLRVIEPR